MKGAPKNGVWKQVLVPAVILLCLAAFFQISLDRTPAGSAERAGNFPSAASLARFMGGIRQYLAYTFFIKTDRLYHEYGSDPELVPYYLLAIYLDPHYVDAYYVVCGLIYEAGRTREALELNERGIEANPDSADLYTSLADIHLREGRIDEAAEAFEMAVELKPRIVPHYTLIKDLAVIYGASGRSGEALRVYLEAVLYNRLRLVTQRDSVGQSLLVKLINDDCGEALPRGKRTTEGGDEAKGN
ncbi:tetratricopeptide repeat protein [Candidatus Solincola tengchongensis]|uniref:tetratricopeptide repeat protein n=1 Tax=Candidatus Solincola tengchongensis TaxID=2900693 RepID=UPI00257A09E8|nr:tetratricopeptide repeat protein [Candidatus Solincola tengchongensis]